MKSRKGITLIALIVTIIVLLILAGISISALVGENGLIAQARKAKEVAERAEIQEKIELAVQSAITNGYGTLDYEELKSELDKTFGEGNYTIVESENGWLITVGKLNSKFQIQVRFWLKVKKKKKNQ